MDGGQSVFYSVWFRARTPLHGRSRQTLRYGRPSGFLSKARKETLALVRNRMFCRLSGQSYNLRLPAAGIDDHVDVHRERFLSAGQSAVLESDAGNLVQHTDSDTDNRGLALRLLA